MINHTNKNFFSIIFLSFFTYSYVSSMIINKEKVEEEYTAEVINTFKKYYENNNHSFKDMFSKLNDKEQYTFEELNFEMLNAINEFFNHDFTKKKIVSLQFEELNFDYLDAINQLLNDDFTKDKIVSLQPVKRFYEFTNALSHFFSYISLNIINSKLDVNQNEQWKQLLTNFQKHSLTLNNITSDELKSLTTGNEVFKKNNETLTTNNEALIHKNNRYLYSLCAMALLLMLSNFHYVKYFIDQPVEQ